MVSLRNPTVDIKALMMVQIASSVASIATDEKTVTVWKVIPSLAMDYL